MARARSASLDSTAQGSSGVDVRGLPVRGERVDDRDRRLSGAPGRSDCTTTTSPDTTSTTVAGNELTPSTVGARCGT